MIKQNVCKVFWKERNVLIKRIVKKQRVDGQKVWKTLLGSYKENKALFIMFGVIHFKFGYAIKRKTVIDYPVIIKII